MKRAWPESVESGGELGVVWTTVTWSLRRETGGGRDVPVRYADVVAGLLAEKMVVDGGVTVSSRRINECGKKNTQAMNPALNEGAYVVNRQTRTTKVPEWALGRRKHWSGHPSDESRHGGSIRASSAVSFVCPGAFDKSEALGEGRKVVKSKCADGKLIIDVAV